jgi:hypothetical protein
MTYKTKLTFCASVINIGCTLPDVPKLELHNTHQLPAAAATFTCPQMLSKTDKNVRNT